MAGASKKKHSLVGTLQVAAILAFVVLAVIVAKTPPGNDEVGAAGAGETGDGPRTAPPVLVTVIHPKARDNRLDIDTTGTIVVRSHVDLMPQVGGRVQTVAAALRAGGQFSAGQALLQIDPRDFELALAQARADIASAQSTLMLQIAESDAAKSNYAILNPGATVPPLVARTPQIEQARANVAAATARADIAALELSRTTFTLPFDGRVVSSSAEVGQLLSRGQSFGRVFAIDAVEAVVPIAPTDLGILQPVQGRLAHIVSGGNEYAATIARVSPQLEERSRFAQLYLSLADQTSLVPGTFVDVTIVGPTYADTYLVPEAAEQINGRVWIVDNDRLQEIQTHPLGRVRDGIIVPAFDAKSGLIIGAVPGGRPGMRVAPVAREAVQGGE